MSYTVLFSRQAQHDAKKLARSAHKQKAEKLIEILRTDPMQSPPRFEPLVGSLEGCYSRRINIQHRLVYEVFEEKKIVLILRMWTHYGE
ncbi:Txe/YoeB family addiction module toxin [Synoicihabitans lomoniglobus]|uniref:Putative mRNA interferase YoeB n=1 Tax=Synoicihabitans lomoniglobus TaxID=2909285 RepID=A0AAF0CMN5_9BACT|nr:Txe/YoeB family addiction module toxin [Opitutaceae bacterium LMO-M01]WED63546.1 Txe/YoeB family addiction module toxin [Opitutaceae bacterium LMO-M01]